MFWRGEAPVEVAAGAASAQAIEIEAARLAIRIAVAAEAEVLRRVEVVAEWPQPNAAGGFVVAQGQAQYDSNIGFDLRPGQRELEVFVPVVDLKLNVWRATRTREQAPAATAEVSPGEGGVGEVEIVVPAGG
jgi:hypothetical protein